MEALQQLEVYITAQKNVAFQFIGIGIGLLILATFLHFLGEGNLSSGLKIGAIVCGCFILFGGIAYLNTENRLLQSQTEIHQKNPTEFMQVEKERMAKVMQDYPVYQMVFGGFIIAAILLVWFVANPYWHGVGFAVITLFSLVMIVEAYSHQSIKSYFAFLGG